MISIEKEEKLFKILRIFPMIIIIVMPLTMNKLESDLSKSVFMASIFLFCSFFFVLLLRKFNRDKIESKDLSGYKRAFKWMGITLLIGVGFIIFHLYNN